MKNLSTLIIAITLLCCGGCSTVKLGYDHADLYLRFKINDYTSFNTKQKNEIRQVVDSYLSWHRKNALPEYVAFLQDIDRVIQKSDRLKVEEVTRLRSEYFRLYKETFSQAAQPAAHMLNTLDNSQIEELGNTFVRKIRKKKIELLYGSDQKNLIMRAERNMEFIERLVGRLSSKQEEEITKISMSKPYVANYFIEYRDTNQAELLKLLKTNAGENQIAAFLWSWVNTPETTRTPQQQQAIQSYENAMDEMTVQIYDLLTERQKIHLHTKIMSYIEDIQHIIAEK